MKKIAILLSVLFLCNEIKSQVKIIDSVNKGFETELHLGLGVIDYNNGLKVNINGVEGGILKKIFVANKMSFLFGLKSLYIVGDWYNSELISFQYLEASYLKLPMILQINQKNNKVSLFVNGGIYISSLVQMEIENRIGSSTLKKRDNWLDLSLGFEANTGVSFFINEKTNFNIGFKIQSGLFDKKSSIIKMKGYYSLGIGLQFDI